MPPVHRSQPKRAKSSESRYSLMKFTREFTDDATCLEHLWRARHSEDGTHAYCPAPSGKRERTLKRYGTTQQRQSRTSAEHEPKSTILVSEIVIDATTAVVLLDLEAVPVGSLTSNDVAAQLVPGARPVKSAHTFAAAILGADPRDRGGRRVLFVSGDDAAAKTAVVELFDAAGFFPVDLGDLVTGGSMQQWGGPLSGHNLVPRPPPGQ
jgi:hypothetical protein